MKKRTLILAVLSTAIIFSATTICIIHYQPKPKELRVVGYLMEYSEDRIDDEMFDRLTHIVLIAGIGGDPIDIVKFHNRSKTEVFIQKVQDMRGDRDVKILYSVAGPISEWTPWQHDATNRSIFVNIIVEFCEDTGLDGIDIDCEHPYYKEDVKALGLLIKDLYKALHAKSKLCSSAVLFGNTGHVKEIIRYQDFINLMIYDNMDENGIHSDYEDHVYYLDILRETHVEVRKINAGIPFYGYKGGPSWDNLSSQRYSQLFLTYHPGPEVDLVNGYSYNGPDTIRKKTEITVEKGFGGMMIWKVSYDLYPQNASSLLYQINQVIPVNNSA
jgi:GH18 family chitinase